MPKLMRLAFAVVLLAATMGLAAPPPRADVTVDVNQGVLQPMPIAIPDFGGAQGADIAKVVENDLEGSGLFKPLDPSTFQERTPNVNVQPQFAAWKQINAQALLDGQTSVTLPGSPSLAVTENGALTWSLWVKMAAPQPNAVLYSRRDNANAAALLIGLDNGTPFVEVTKPIV